MRLHSLWLLLVLAPIAGAQDRVQVVTTTATLRSIVEAVGGDRVEVTSLARGVEDPHFVVATPTLMVKAADADLFVEIGMNLEIWSGNVIDGSRNPRIRTGANGRVIASRGVSSLEVPTQMTRAEGDLHPQGNPHVWLDPMNGAVLAANVAEGLTRVDPAGKDHYAGRLREFVARLDEAMFGKEVVELLGAEYVHRLQASGELVTFLEQNEWEGKPLVERLGGWRKKMLPLRGSAWVGYHKTWPYLAAAFDLEFVEQLEPKPGISPTPSHLAHVRDVIRDRRVKAIFCETYFDFGKARGVAEEACVAAIRAPTEVGGDEQATDYFRLFDRLTDLMTGS